MFDLNNSEGSKSSRFSSINDSFMLMPSDQKRELTQQCEGGVCKSSSVNINRNDVLKDVNGNYFNPYVKSINSENTKLTDINTKRQLPTRGYEEPDYNQKFNNPFVKDVRFGQSTRMLNEEQKLFDEGLDTSSYQIKKLNKNFQDPNHIILPFARGGENTRIKKTEDSGNKPELYEFNY